MKSIVIYFSQSGNTKKIAQAIHSGMSRSGDQSDIARLKDVAAEDLAGYDLIGIGTPVYWGRETANMTGFIESWLPLDGKHGFAFCTHGALPSMYMARVVPAMEQRGLTVVGWNDWFGSVVYPAIPKPYFTDGHPDEIDLKEAEDFGREMVERSRRIYKGETQLIPVLPRGKAYDAIYNPPGRVSEMPLEERVKFVHWETCMQFKLNPEKCKYPKCTHCIDNCPTNSIELSLDPPVFTKGNLCITCYLCEQTCPQGAIEADMEGLQKGHDPYIHPVLMKSLEGFEALGHFRRLTPLDKIGWDTPFWKRKKPRFKIGY
jgi:flavodoxin/NAD-dependent dihydropyrimidine dehydrogenase PreA subunit